jgi:hypothetical protein
MPQDAMLVIGDNYPLTNLSESPASVYSVLKVCVILYIASWKLESISDNAIFQKTESRSHLSIFCQLFLVSSSLYSFLLFA